MKKIIFILSVILVLTIIGCKQDNALIEQVDCTMDPTNSVCHIDDTNKEDDENNIEDNGTIPYVEDLLNDMTLIEKAAQMVQAERGSVSPQKVQEYGIGSILSGGGSHPTAYDNSPSDWYNMYKDYQDAALASSSGIPILYGIDAVHGNNNLYQATIFPHNIGLGAANDPDLTYAISKATAEEMLITGINWTFAPALSVVQNISWGRTYEGYSENPIIHKNLTQAAILGFQENGVSATAKHFFGDGGTSGGVDQGNSVMLTDEVKQLHLSPYIEAIEAGVDTVMISYSSVNDIKMHSSSYWIQDTLKDEMGFEGFVVSDWNAIHQLPGDFKTQIVTSINAGIDMLMEPYDWEQTIGLIVEAVNDDLISQSRIDDAVRRILTVKYHRGLFSDPYKVLEGDYLYNDEHKNIARKAVRESLVLLKNNQSSLPLSKTDTIYLTGSASDNVGLLCGGWTRYWQGTTEPNLTVGTSIKTAFENVLDNAGGRLVNNVDDANTVVVVLSEDPYSEGAGDNNELTLTGKTASSENQSALQIAIEAHNQGKNVVGILVSGRPLLITNELQYFDSFVAAWLPGTEGGNGISDVLFGDFDFIGTLSYTWPRDISQVGYNSNDLDYDEMFVLYPFGYGLAYKQN
jgi:beta-glucosidase